MATLNPMAENDPAALTPDGEPIAQLTPPLPKRKVRFGSMQDRIQLLPGWDDPVDLDRFLDGEV